MNRWLFTAEHAGNEVPKPYQHQFERDLAVLDSHEGYDPGTGALTQSLAPLADAVFTYPYSRLLIEVNRSTHHPKLFSRFSRNLSRSDKRQLIKVYYTPHWQRINRQIEEWIRDRDRIYHIGVHSFTPVLHGHKRNADIGLLYDPSRSSEKAWALEWKGLLEQHQFKVRRNYPYLGKADGLITQMRRRFTDNYYGIELELNQELLESTNQFQLRLVTAINSTLTELQKKY